MIHTNLFSNIRISGAFLGPLTMLMLTCFHTILISVNHSNQIIPHRFQSTVSFWGSDQGLDKGRKRHICKKKGQISNHRQLGTANKATPKTKVKIQMRTNTCCYYDVIKGTNHRFMFISIERVWWWYTRTLL